MKFSGIQKRSHRPNFVIFTLSSVRKLLTITFLLFVTVIVKPPYYLLINQLCNFPAIHCLKRRWGKLILNKAIHCLKRRWGKLILNKEHSHKQLSYCTFKFCLQQLNLTQEFVLT